MKVKVCGMKYRDNIRSVSLSSPDMLGFIFYKKSPRFVRPNALQAVIEELPQHVQTVGVFVNENLSRIKRIVRMLQLDFVQLHGLESVETVKKLKEENIAVIKAFHIDNEFDWSTVQAYETDCFAFIFDTAGSQWGGHGKQFNWSKLSLYQGQRPYLLSGGIDNESVQRLRAISDERFIGVDINSRFEVSPGRKNIQLVSSFIKRLNHE